MTSANVSRVEKTDTRSGQMSVGAMWLAKAVEDVVTPHRTPLLTPL